MLTAEDDIEDTVVPRLVAAGADLKRVVIVKTVRRSDGKRQMFSLATDLELLRRKIQEVGDVKLIVIDPIIAYQGRRVTDIRSLLTPVTDLAAELRVLIIAIAHFNKKVSGREAMLRIAGNLAYVAVSRSTFVVTVDRETGQRLFAMAKGNLGPDDIKALAYSIATRKVGVDKKLGTPIVAPYITWEEQPVVLTANEAVAAEAGQSQRQDKGGAAQALLLGMLAMGPVPTNDIESAAAAKGISKRAMESAKKELGIIAMKQGHHWMWRAP